MNKNLLLLLALLSFGGLALGDDSPRSKIQKMCHTMSNSSYRGVFVHISSNKVTGMEIYRHKDSQRDLERLVSLNNDAIEVIRDNESLKCIIPKQKTVILDSARLGSNMPISLPSDLENVDANYRIKKIGEENIAGYACESILLTPKDKFRYGYLLCIAKSNNLLLKSVLLDQSGQAKESMVFTKLQLVNKLPYSLFKPKTDTSNYRINSQRQQQSAQNSELLMPSWRLQSLPQGFYLVSHSRTEQKQGFKEHMVLSDGMATVSIFIEKKLQLQLQGTTQRGAVNVYVRNYKGNQIMAVGEVPMQTVKMLANLVELK